MKFRMCIATALCAITPIFAVDFQGGSGTPEDPYQIATAQQLIDMGSDPNLMDKCYMLVQDIDLDPDLPGGRVFDRALIAPHIKDGRGTFQGTPFSGRFDGNGHSIHRLSIDGIAFLGLFGWCEVGAVVSNLDLEEVDVNGDMYTGALVGENRGCIASVVSGGAVNGIMWVGGLVGSNSKAGQILESNSSASVHGSGYVGGLAGSNTEFGCIGSSSSTGPVHGDQYVGGLVGGNENGQIWSSSSSSVVHGNRTVGGLVGENLDSVIWSSYSVGDVDGLGGFGLEGIGGLVGENDGGLISSSYSRSKVSGGFNRTGGLVGDNSRGDIQSCYSVGVVNGDRGVGGLVGRNTGRVLSSFWDMQASGQSDSDGGLGLETAAMQTIQSYLEAGWDFLGEVENGSHSIWQHFEGAYPILTAFADSTPMPLPGDGTEESPFLISEADDIGAVWHRPLAHYRLTADIDLMDITHDMAIIPWFNGSFDGQQRSIQSLKIQGVNYLGLFGILGPLADVTNVHLLDASVEGSINMIGALAGLSDGIVSSCHSTGTITGGEFRFARVQHIGATGGLVGYNRGQMSRCSSASTVSGDMSIGGIAGSLRSGTITFSFNEGRVSGRERAYVGGLTGLCYSGSVSSCYNTGAIGGNTMTGGIVGRKEYGSIITCYNTGFIQGGSSWTGAIAGLGSASASFWDAETSGISESNYGTGLPTAEMQTASPFLKVGWDFVGETENGTEDIWWIDEGNDYPRFWWELPPEE